MFNVQCFLYFCSMNPMQRLLSVYPQREARALYMLVMEVAFGLTPTQVLTGKDNELSSDKRALLQNIIDRLLRKEPVQYILGQSDFCGHTFHVAPGVLIPRPETEGLVRLIGQHSPTPCSVLDIGTGSGCIAVSLALMGHKVTAMDVSADALSIARENARRLQADILFLQEDILHPTPTQQQWDVIVSNPPYVCQKEAAQMDSNVLDYEPQSTRHTLQKPHHYWNRQDSLKSRLTQIVSINQDSFQPLKHENTHLRTSPFSCSRPL